MFAIASLLWAAALGGIAWLILDLMNAPRIVDAKLGRFEVERREKLREASPIYRACEPWIDELAATGERLPTKKMQQVETDLIGCGDSAPWKPSEFLAAVNIESVLATLGGVAFGYLFSGGVTALLFGMMTYVGYQAIRLRSLAQRSEKRRGAIRRRMASAIDLMSLMMEVGAGFQDSLETIAKEAGDHPLGEEFRRILRDLAMGLPRRDALKSFADRMTDTDTRELMAAIIEGETLGTPLADTIRTQAEQLRLKRSQWAEKAAEESKVALVFPAMLIMVACLVIVIAPFILSALYTL